MKLDLAKEIVAPLWIQIEFDKSANSYVLVLDEHIEYISAEDFNNFDVPDFKTFVGRKVIDYVKAFDGVQPKLHFH